MENPLILTFDVGTQSTRAMLVDKHGHIVDICKCNYEKPYFSTVEGYAEQKPDFYFEYMIKACNGLKEQAKELMDNIIGVTVTVIRDTVLCLDKNNKPLRDVIVWLDKREANPDELPSIPLGKKILFNLVGVNDTINMQQRQSACNWIMTKEKDLWERTSKFVMLPTYINYLLTGKLVDSIANQIGHVPFDYKNGKWMSKNGLTRFLFDVPTEKLCQLVKSGDIIGIISDDVSDRLQIKHGLPLIATGSDKSCETLGLSVTTKYKAAVSFGTTATVQFATPNYFEPSSNCPAYPSVVNGTYNPEIQIYRGYWMLSWYKKEFAEKEELEAKKLGTCAEELLNKHLNEIDPGCDGLILQPFWSPGVSNPLARGTITGFKDFHTRYHIYKAIIEGIDFALLEGLEQMERRGHQHIDEIYVGGGGSQSDEILQISANIFNRPVKRIQTHEACGLGAAAIGFVALNEYKNVDEAIKYMVQDKDVFYPEVKNAKLYHEIYTKVYKKLARQVDPLFKTMKGIEKEYE